MENLVVKQAFAVGVTVYSKKDLEKLLSANEKVDIKVVGMLVLGEDIDVELARKTINSVQVKGIYKASAEIKKARTLTNEKSGESTAVLILHFY